ncbi:Murein DD-endopeptidase MepH precursor [compost metagenome]
MVHIVIRLFFCTLLLLSFISPAKANLQRLDKAGEPPHSWRQELDATLESLIERAHQLIGVKYRWGGMSETSGFDCSGLLVYLFRSEAGVHVPRTTASMLKSRAPTVAQRKLKPGDAVFFNRNGRGQTNHVGLYIGEGKFIHAPRTGKTIRIDSLNNRYWNRSYITAKRFHGPL